MNYELEFLKEAKKEWDKLDNNAKMAFKKVLKRRLVNPIVEKDKLSNTIEQDCYKIKLKALGLRLVYKVEQDKLILLIITIGKREKDEVYKIMHDRLKKL